jgi:hypothetical protein
MRMSFLVRVSFLAMPVRGVAKSKRFDTYPAWLITLLKCLSSERIETAVHWPITIHKGTTLKHLATTFTSLLVTLLIFTAGSARAQTPTPDASIIAGGHMHLVVPNVAKHREIWKLLGGVERSSGQSTDSDLPSTITDFSRQSWKPLVPTLSPMTVQDRCLRIYPMASGSR